MLRFCGLVTLLAVGCTSGVIEPPRPTFDAAVDTNLEEVLSDDAPADRFEAGPTLVCPTDFLTGTGLLAMGNNAESADNQDPGCGGRGGKDVLFRYRASEAGTFRFFTDGSSYDTLLELRSGCVAGIDPGATLCDDEGGMMPNAASLLASLEVDQEIYIALDAFDANNVGDYQLHAERILTDVPSCPDSSLAVTGTGTVATGRLTGQGDDFAFTCGANSDDVAVRYRAPEAGRYLFRTAEGRPLELRASCDATEALTCSTVAAVFTDLDQDEEVIVVVDRLSLGQIINYTLQAEPLAGLSAEDVFTSQNRSATRSCECEFFFSSECFFRRLVPPAYITCRQNTFASVSEELRDAILCQALAETQRAQCVENVACFSSAACETAYRTAISSCPIVPQTAWDVATDSCFCPEIAGASNIGQIYIGTLRTGPDLRTISCNGTGAAEVTVSWTAPSTGTFIANTAGSTFDTVLQVARSCSSAALACNDNGGPDISYSSIRLTVNQGDTFVFTLEPKLPSRFTPSGTAVLNINPEL